MGTILDVTGTPQSGRWGALNPGYGGYISSYEGIYPSVGVDSAGIIVGIGSTPVTLNDYNLDNKISTGNGPGQLAYQDQLVGSTSVALQVTTTRITRSFINNSGSSIDVAEVGIEGRSNDVGYVGYLMIRDVIVSPVTVANGATLNVYIDLQVTA